MGTRSRVQEQPSWGAFGTWTPRGGGLEPFTFSDRKRVESSAFRWTTSSARRAVENTRNPPHVRARSAPPSPAWDSDDAANPDPRDRATLGLCWNAPQSGTRARLDAPPPAASARNLRHDQDRDRVRRVERLSRAARGAVGIAVQVLEVARGAHEAGEAVLRVGVVIGVARDVARAGDDRAPLQGSRDAEVAATEGDPGLVRAV